MGASAPYSFTLYFLSEMKRLSLFILFMLAAMLVAMTVALTVGHEAGVLAGTALTLATFVKFGVRVMPGVFATGCAITMDLGLNDCDSQDSPGAGGIKQVWLFNFQDLISFSEDADLYITDIVLQNGARSFILDALLDTAEAIVADVRDDNGLSKNIRFNFRIHPRTPKVRRELEKLFKNYVVVLTLENDGNYYLYALQNGLKGIEGTESSGLTQDAARSYSIGIENLRENYNFGKRQLLLPGATAADRKANTIAFVNALQTQQFGFIVSGSNPTIAAGASGVSALSITRDQYTTGDIVFSLVSAEGGVDITSAGLTVTGTNTTGNFPINVGAGVSAGTYDLIIQATGGGYVDIFKVAVTV